MDAPFAFGWMTTPRRALPISMLSAVGKLMPGGTVGLSQGVTKIEMTNYINEKKDLVIINSILLYIHRNAFIG